MHYLIENNLPALEEICKNFNVKRLFVFGSLGNDTFDINKSDVDLIVELDEKDPVEKGEKLMILWHKFEEFIGNLTFDEYRADLKAKSAVERQLGIIGEAVNNYKKL